MSKISPDLAHARPAGTPGKRPSRLTRLDQQLLSILQHQPFVRSFGAVEARTQALLPLLPALTYTLRAHHPETDFDQCWSGALLRLEGLRKWVALTFPGAELIADRSDLLTLPAWAGFTSDTDGNPVVWENHYQSASGEEWSDCWSSQCDDDNIAPYESTWIGPNCQDEKALWDILDDAGW